MRNRDKVFIKKGDIIKCIDVRVNAEIFKSGTSMLLTLNKTYKVLNIDPILENDKIVFINLDTNKIGGMLASRFELAINNIKFYKRILL